MWQKVKYFHWSRANTEGLTTFSAVTSCFKPVLPSFCVNWTDSGEEDRTTFDLFTTALCVSSSSDQRQLRCKHKFFERNNLWILGKSFVNKFDKKHQKFCDHPPWSLNHYGVSCDQVSLSTNHASKFKKFLVRWNKLHTIPLLSTATESNSNFTRCENVDAGNVAETNSIISICKSQCCLLTSS